MDKTKQSEARVLAEALEEVFESFSVMNSSGCNANIVDVIDDVSRSAKEIALAITPAADPANDAAGGRVGSLTEAVMGLTCGLIKIAEGLESIADAIRDSKK
jgi:hypothetical protein